MVSKLPDLPLILFIAASLLGFILQIALGASSQAPTAVAIGVTIVLYSYAIYWSFNIRHVLAVRLYRNQALGIGLVSLSFLIFLFAEIAIVNIYSSSSGPAFLPAWYPFAYSFSILVFYWIDASVLTARRSDPLLRYTLGWKQVRIVLWGISLISVAAVFAGLLYLAVTVGLPGNAPPNFPQPVQIIEHVPFYVPSAAGAIYLPVTAFRSKDKTLRRHLMWFGWFLASQLAFIIIVSIPVSNVCHATPCVSTIAAIRLYVSFVALSIGGYLLYRSTLSLVPLNRIEPEVNST
jgi:hypothetical protein